MNYPDPRVEVSKLWAILYRQTMIIADCIFFCSFHHVLWHNFVSLLQYRVNQRYWHNIHLSRSFHPKVIVLLLDMFYIFLWLLCFSISLLFALLTDSVHSGLESVYGLHHFQFQETLFHNIDITTKSCYGVWIHGHSYRHYNSTFNPDASVEEFFRLKHKSDTIHRLTACISCQLIPIKKTPCFSRCYIGGRYWNWTSDLLHVKQAL